MEYYIKQYFYQRKKHYLSIVSLTITLILTVCMKNLCNQIRVEINGFYQKQGMDISCVIVLNENDDFFNLEKGAVKCFHGLYGDNEIIITDESFYDLFSFDYYLLTENDGITISYQIYENNNYRNELVYNGIVFPVKRVLTEECSNIYFDSTNLIIIPEDYSDIADFKEIRYYYKGNISIQADEDSYQLLSQDSLKQGLDAVLAIIEGLLKLISLITISAAIISQSNHSILLLENNSRLIGIKKANGASDRDIGREVMFENILTAILADTIATKISQIILRAADIKISFFSMFKDNIILVGIIVLLSCAIPIIRSRKITIIDSIRKEN